MKTIRFYEMTADFMENDVYSTKELTHEFRLELPEDFDLDDAFGILSEKTGCDVCSFRYENVT